MRRFKRYGYKIVLGFTACILILISPYETGFVTVAAAPVYDVIIENGTVIDPETNTHEVMNVGIRDGVIEALGKEKLHGETIIDASGKYVVPGFIDLQAYGPRRFMSLYKIADGVTTSLTLHGGTADFSAWADKVSREGHVVNFGSAVSHQFMRLRVGVKDRYVEATEAQIKRMVTLTRRSLADGALGVSFSLEYTPGATYEEIRPLFKVAAEFGVPCFMHLRYSDPHPPGTNAEAIAEAVRLATETGASIHIHHITSTGGTHTMAETAAEITRARKLGLDITACIYPYTYWATYLSTARFDRGWRKRFDIDYNDLQLAGTSERLTAETFRKYRREGRLAIAYAIPEGDVITAIRTPWIMIGSDGSINRSGQSHPRGAGSFSRTVARYVRGEKVVTLDEAIAKMTLAPARVIESAAPSMKKKGRIQIGMDADIVVFDYNTIQDRATVEEPRQYSDGIEYVLVAGVVVRDHDRVTHLPVGSLIRAERPPEAAHLLSP